MGSRLELREGAHGRGHFGHGPLGGGTELGCDGDERPAGPAPMSTTSIARMMALCVETAKRVCGLTSVRRRESGWATGSRVATVGRTTADRERMTGDRRS